MKPFLKWPGNKYRLMEHIKKILPPANRLVEPFAGSGAVSLSTTYDKYLLAEKNPDLVNLYHTLIKDQSDFIEDTKELFNDKYNKEQTYYRLRKQFNTTSDLQLKATLFVYLNKHGFNGLCRYNLDGEYNVPFGFYRRTYFPAKEMLFFAKKLKGHAIRCWDYKKTMRYTKAGDIVYCDPPYVPLSKTANFTQYGPFAFNTADQIALAEKAMQLTHKGISVIVSNHNTSFIRELYADATIYTINVNRSISCNPATRGRVKEVLALFSPD